MSNNNRKDYVWNTIGVLAQNAISPLLLIIITRLNGVYDSGVFSYAFSVALVFWAFSIWGGRTYQVSDLKNEFTANSYVMARILLGAGVLVASVLFCLVNGYDYSKSAIIVAFVLVKVTESVADAVYGILQIRDKLYITGRSLFIKSLLGIAVFVAVDTGTGSLLLAALSLAVVNILVFLLYDLYFARAVGYRITSISGGTTKYAKESLEIIRRCAPIAAVIFLSMFSLNIPRYFLDMFHIKELGFFGILVMAITVLSLVITFLIQPKIVHLSELFSGSKYRELNRSVRVILSVVVVSGLIGLTAAYFVGVPLLNFVFNLDFTTYKSALLVVIIGAILNGVVSVLMNIFTIIRHFKALFYTLVATNITLVFLSIIFVEMYGLFGAVVLYTCTSFVQALVLIGTYGKVMKGYMERL